MAHTHNCPQFLLLEEAAINVTDISTAKPYREDETVPAPGGDYFGVRVTMQSKGTQVHLPGWTMEQFNELLRHA